MKKITIQIENELKTKFKGICNENDETMKEVITAAIKSYIKLWSGQ